MRTQLHVLEPENTIEHIFNWVDLIRKNQTGFEKALGEAFAEVDNCKGYLAHKNTFKLHFTLVHKYQKDNGKMLPEL